MGFVSGNHGVCVVGTMGLLNANHGVPEENDALCVENGENPQTEYEMKKRQTVVGRLPLP